MGVEIAPFGDEHGEGAAELLAARHARHREAEPLLPALEDPGAEIERARSRGDDDGRTEQALRHLAGVLLHTPSVRARDYARAGAQEAYLTGLEALFGIEVPAEPAVARPQSDDSAATA